MKDTFRIAVIVSVSFLVGWIVAGDMKTPPPSSQAQPEKTSYKSTGDEVLEAKTPKNRFFILSATLTVETDGGDHAPISVVLRLDQQTGQTEMLSALLTPSNAVYRFVPIQ